MFPHKSILVTSQPNSLIRELDSLEAKFRSADSFEQIRILNSPPEEKEEPLDERVDKIKESVNEWFDKKRKERKQLEAEYGELEKAVSELKSEKEQLERDVAELGVLKTGHELLKEESRGSRTDRGNTEKTGAQKTANSRLVGGFRKPRKEREMGLIRLQDF